MSKQKVNKVNTSINSIEKAAVQILSNAQEARFAAFRAGRDEVSKQLHDFVFGKTDENPFEAITARYNEDMANLREKTASVAKVEKDNYLGKSRKGVKSVKKIADEVAKEVK